MGRAALPDVAQGPDTSENASRQPRRRWRGLAALSGLIAIAAAVLLPVAPVHMNQPVVSWPLDPGAPQSSMLELTAQQPLGLDVRFSCRAARAAAQTEDRIVLATIRPGQPALDDVGLIIRASPTRVTADVAGEQVLDEPLGSENCRYRVSLRPDELTVRKDDTATSAPGSVDLPQVDVLATSITSIPDADADDLSVEVFVDDQFSTSPTAVKLILTILLVAAVATTLVLVGLRERSRTRKAGRAAKTSEQPEPGTPAPHRHLPRLADLAVVAAIVLWTFLAPMTDDDGYYAAMARNSSAEGYVGNFYQLLNQSFTPFTWFYRLLGSWESLVGDSQVLLRIPALTAGLATWALIRRFTTRPDVFPDRLRMSKWGPGLIAGTLAVTFLAWWLPYDMGVRPEGIVALLSAAVLLAVQSAIRLKSLFYVGIASAFAAFAIVCHPTGFVALAPILVALPCLWPILRGNSLVATGRNFVVATAPASLASALAFADGSLHDFVHGQELFLSRFQQSRWYDEFNRYGLLLLPDAQGNFAKRAAVLVGLVSLLWFAALLAASRGRGIRLSTEFQLTGWSLALGLVLLWITPSKWSHHFGALAGLGPVFLTVFLLSAPSIVARLTRGRRISRPVTLTVAFTAITVFSLSLHGPNSWAYSWLLGMPYANLSPRVGSFALESVPAWIIAYLLVFLVLRRRAQRKKLEWRSTVSAVAAPTMAILFLVLSTGYLVGGFGVASLRTWDTYSPWANNLKDPLARDCDATGAIDVLDDSSARPLSESALPQETSQDPEGTASSFEEQGGFLPANPPPGGVGSGAALQVWGSLSGPEEEAGFGSFTSPWFDLPTDLASEERVGLVAAGRLDGGNSLVVEYGERVGDRVTTIEEEDLTDSIDSPIWRSIPLAVDDALESGANSVRVVATDATADVGGWLAFTAPSVQRTVSLQDYIPADAAVGLSWQFAFLFPCQRQPTLQNGITEPVEYGVLYGTEDTNGLNDNTWTIYAGGVFGPVTRVAGVTQVPSELRDFPHITTLQIYRFENPYPTAAYELRRESVPRWGWQAPWL